MTEPAPPSAVELRVLGPPAVRRGGEDVQGLVAQPKRVALLCWLALDRPGDTRGREDLAALFWPDLPPRRARAALRQSLYHLRRAMGPGILTGKGDDEVGLDEDRVRSDAEAFDAALERDEPEVALDLYRGEFLADLEVPDAGREWSTWVSERRADYRARAAAAAINLAEAGFESGSPSRARAWAERALAIDPADPRARELAEAARLAEGKATGPSRRSGRWAAMALAVGVLALVGWGAWTRFVGGTSAGPDPGRAVVPFVEPEFGGLHELRIVFDSTRDGNNEIYAINADGTEPIRLTLDPARDVRPRWSPDGRWIVFSSDRDGNADLYLVDPMGESLRRLTSDPGEDVDPTFSPDGRRIAWASDREGSFDLYVMDLDGSSPRRLTDHAGEERNPDFSPDGTRIVFQATIDAGGNPNGVDLYVLDVEGDGPPRRLNDPLTYDAEPAWSPDGSRIVFSSIRDDPENREIWVMEADGSGERNLTHAAGSDRSPRWSPDGARILFRSDRAGGPDLYVMDADGSKVRRVTRRGARRADWRGRPPLDPACLVVNGSFEEVEERHSSPDDDKFYGVPGWRPVDALWRSGGYHNSPDLFVAPEFVPVSIFGLQYPAHGRNYAGVAHGGSGVKALGATEALGGALREPLRPGRAYEIRARLSNSDTYSQLNIVEIDLHSRRTGGVLRVDTLRLENDVVWTPYRRRIEIPAADAQDYDEIVFRGANPPVSGRGYYFVDDVDVCPID